MKKSLSKAIIAVSALTLFLCGGCVSESTRISAGPGNYEIIGESDATAGGFVLFGLIPIEINDMFERAYHDAVKKRNADDLVETIVKEKYFWTPGGMIRFVEIKGLAVRNKDKASTYRYLSEKTDKPAPRR